jgi:RNA polymerase sigma factor (sigma-70 family)
MTQPLLPKDHTVSDAVLREDRMLIDGCLRGDEDAWERLLLRYKNLIFSVPIQYGLSREEAAEIFQSVCVDLFCELRNLRDPKALPAWLIRVSYRKSYHQRENSQRDVVSDEALAPLVADQNIPTSRLDDLQRDQSLRRALDSLDSRCHQLVTMLFFESPTRPYEKVAKSLSLPVGSIGPIRRRCLGELRKALEQAGFQ